MDRRKFRVAVSYDKKGTGVGIVEQHGHTIIYIASLYAEGISSWREAVDFAVLHIENLVGDQDAIIRFKGHVPRYKTTENIKIRSAEKSFNMQDCNSLSLDALENRRSIEEVL